MYNFKNVGFFFFFFACTLDILFLLKKYDFGGSFYIWL